MESEEISFENTCRLCLKRITGQSLRVSIFETDLISHSSIPVKIKTCVCIDVQAADPLPQYICQDCHSKLDNFFAFKQVCLDADLKLKTLLQCTTKHGANEITNVQDTSRGSFDKTTKDLCKDITIERMHSRITTSPVDTDMFETSTIKNEPHSEEECGLAEATELDALSNNSDDAEIGSSTSEPSATNECLSIRILDASSLTRKDQKSHEIYVKGEPDDNSNITAMTEVPDRVVFCPITTEISITEQEPLDKDIPLAHYMRRKIIGVHNGNFIYNINDEVTSNNRPKTKQKKGLHKKHNTFRKNHRCHSCSESFRRLSDMKAHLDTHLPSELKRFVCCVCPEAFSEKKYVENHEQHTHMAASFYLCKQCTTRCLTLHQLRQHVKTHQSKTAPRVNRGSFVCNKCKRMFGYTATFRNHVCRDLAKLESETESRESGATKSETQPDVYHPTFDCNECGVTFKHKGALICHQATNHRTITDNKNGIPRVTPKFNIFGCNVCGTVFEHKGALICHQGVCHRNSTDDGDWTPRMIPKFQCLRCDISYPRKRDLMQHEACVHGKIGPADGPTASLPQPAGSQTFLCEPCNQTFKHKGALICHQAFYHRLEMNRKIVQPKT